MPETLHNAVRQQLRGYVDGSLSELEQLAIEQHVSSCDACRDELADIELAHRCGTHSSDVDRRAGESGLDEWLTHIDEVDPTGAPPATRMIDPAATNGRVYRCRLWPWRFPGGLVSQRLLCIILVATLCTVLMASGLLYFWRDADSASAISYLLRPVSSHEFADPRRLRVVFEPQTSIEQIIKLLRELDADIVQGPTEIGVLTVHLNVGETPEVAVAQAIVQLRTKSFVVLAAPVAKYFSHD